MKRKGIILTWTYAVELFLVGLVYALMLHVIGGNALMDVMDKNWQVFMSIGGALLAVGITLSIWFWQALDGDFGKYLKWRKADGHYLRAYQVQVILFLLAAGLPASMAFGRNDWMAHAAWCTLIYACVNGLTVVRNTVHVVHLRQKFQSDYDAVALEMKRDDT